MLACGVGIGYRKCRDIPEMRKLRDIWFDGRDKMGSYKAVFDKVNRIGRIEISAFIYEQTQIHQSDLH